MKPMLVALAAFVLPAAAMGAPLPKSIPFEETGPFLRVDDTGPHRTSRELLRAELDQEAKATAPPSVSQDVGDVAVIVDNGRIIDQPRPNNPFDLPVPTSITFTPQQGTVTARFSDVAFDPNTGTALSLGDDDSIEVGCPDFAFPFLGTSYQTFFVNSDGNVTFGQGDPSHASRDGARLIGGPPRIAPLLADLDPRAGGSVRLDCRADRAVITWDEVPQWGVPNVNTFQIVLHADGQIDLVYQTVQFDTSTRHATVGLAAGGDERPYSEVDLTRDLPTSFRAGALFEEFSPAIPKQVNVIAAAREFYKTHADKYDYLVVFSDFPVQYGGAFSFYMPMQNHTLGLGLTPVFDRSALAGSAGELEGIVSMNWIGLYWPDASMLVNPPIKMFRFDRGASLEGPPGADQLSLRARWFGTEDGGAFTLGLNSAMSIMAQEAGHRWLATALFVHPTKGIGFDSLDLLGRAYGHWSFFFDTRVPDTQFGGDPRASSMEGNAIRDLGPDDLVGYAPFPCTHPGETTFGDEPNELIDGYTELDQYFMGLRRADEVAPFWYADDPRSAVDGNPLPSEVRTWDALDDVKYCGKRVDLTVQDIQDFPLYNHGPRVPAIGDEIDSCGKDVKTMAFILVVEQGPPDSPDHAAAISRVQTFLETWKAYADGPATGGRGLFDTSLDPVCY